MFKIASFSEKKLKLLPIYSPCADCLQVGYFAIKSHDTFWRSFGTTHLSVNNTCGTHEEREGYLARLTPIKRYFSIYADPWVCAKCLQPLLIDI